MRKIIVFEGPDGAGKSTLAKKVAEALDATVIHHGPYPEVTDGLDLARIYRDSMAGPESVVLDRCWISERPYGMFYRNRFRISSQLAMYLEDCAEDSGEAHVYLCLPPWGRVRDNFLARKGAEYLDSLEQLGKVYGWYYRMGKNVSHLDVTVIDPFDGRDHVREIIDDLHD